MRAAAVRLVALLVVVAVAAASAQQSTQERPPDQPRPEQPRFRGGANLVRLDAYVMADGTAVTDLTAKDFEVLEDNVPQRVESFRLVQPRAPGPQSTRREPNTVAESQEAAVQADARAFVLFMDIWHVQIDGSYHAQGPVTEFLNRVIGQDDLVGVMTPEMSARTLTFARRLTTIEGIFKDNWFWGQRDRITSPDPREGEIEKCYPKQTEEHEYIVSEMVLRRRQARTLNALEDLIVHLERIREERKFVLLLTEGWTLRRPDQRLAAPIEGPDETTSVPGRPAPIGSDPEGRLHVDGTRSARSAFASCERERSLLALSDYQSQFDALSRLANRANVSFYPLDPRGLVVFDQAIGGKSRKPPPPPSVDAARLQARYDVLRELAVQTDGYAILNTNQTVEALERMVQDTGAYYLLGYYSTNTRLDGKYRRLTVRVKRPGVQVRARPGYLAPTEAEMASSRVDGLMNGAPPGYSTIPTEFARALERLTPIRGILPVRVQGAASARQIWITTELDATTLKSAEWLDGGRARVFFEHDRGDTPPMQTDVSIAPGQRMFSVTPPEGVTLAPGRYVVRLQLTPKNGSIPIQTTVDVFVPKDSALLSQSTAALRRGPSTGLQYHATADARFRRTERLRLEVVRVAEGGVASARLLARDGQPLPLAVSLSERSEPDQARLIVADLTLAPLAQGEYVIEVMLEKDGNKERAAYAFRIVP